MFGSATVYCGLIVTIAGLVLVVKPLRRLRVTMRWRGAGVAGAGVLLAGIGLTRVFASGPAARRRFAAYWRVIYPGSALIRRMWLRAIERRATSPNEDRKLQTSDS